MLEVLELEKSVNTEKDTWILKLPSEICNREGFAEGTMVSMTIKNGGIQTTFISPPSKIMQKISKQILKEDCELYEELRRIGD